MIPRKEDMMSLSPSLLPERRISTHSTPTPPRKHRLLCSAPPLHTVPVRHNLLHHFHVITVIIAVCPIVIYTAGAFRTFQKKRRKHGPISAASVLLPDVSGPLPALPVCTQYTYTLVVLILTIAESRTEEKDIMVKVIINLINKNN